MAKVYHRSSGKWEALNYDDSKSFIGQEGAVYRTAKRDTLVKIFDDSDKDYLAHKLKKVQVMLKPEFRLYFADRPQPDFAWPRFAVYRKREEAAFIGFGMHALDNYSHFDDLFSESAIGCIMEDHERANACAYLAHLFGIAHRKSVLVGDVKPNNILIDPKVPHVALIDCDSFQFSENGTTFTSNVGTRDYISPRLVEELESRRNDFKNVVRKEDDDLFCLAIMSFRALMGGFHPFHTDQKGSKTVDNIRHRRFPYAVSQVGPPSRALPALFQRLSPELRKLFIDIFVHGKAAPATEWRDTLHRYAVSVARSPAHAKARPAKPVWKPAATPRPARPATPPPPPAPPSPWAAAPPTTPPPVTPPSPPVVSGFWGHLKHQYRRLKRAIFD